MIRRRGTPGYRRLMQGAPPRQRAVESRHATPQHQRSLRDTELTSVMRFTVRRVAVTEFPEARTLVVGIAEKEDGTGRGLLFQVSLEAPSRQDLSLGQATYCTSADNGRTTYGGIERLELRDGKLVVRFDEHAAGEVGMARDVEATLAVDENAIRELRAGLERLFSMAPGDAPQLSV